MFRKRKLIPLYTSISSVCILGQIFPYCNEVPDYKFNFKNTGNCGPKAVGCAWLLNHFPKGKLFHFSKPNHKKELGKMSLG